MLLLPSLLFMQICIASANHSITFINNKDHDIQLGGPSVIHDEIKTGYGDQVSRCMIKWDEPASLITLKPGGVYTTQITDKNSGSCINAPKINSYLIRDEKAGEDKYIQWVHGVNNGWTTQLGLCNKASIASKYNHDYEPCGAYYTVAPHYPAGDWQLPSGTNSTENMRPDDGSVLSTITVFIK